MNSTRTLDNYVLAMQQQLHCNRALKFFAHLISQKVWSLYSHPFGCNLCKAHDIWNRRFPQKAIDSKPEWTGIARFSRRDTVFSSLFVDILLLWVVFFFQFLFLHHCVAIRGFQLLSSAQFDRCAAILSGVICARRTPIHARKPFFNAQFTRPSSICSEETFTPTASIAGGPVIRRCSSGFIEFRFRRLLLRPSLLLLRLRTAFPWSVKEEVFQGITSSAETQVRPPSGSCCQCVHVHVFTFPGQSVYNGISPNIALQPSHLTRYRLYVFSVYWQSFKAFFGVDYTWIIYSVVMICVIIDDHIFIARKECACVV